MFQYSDWFTIYVFMFSNEIRPYKCHTYHCDKSCDAFHVTHMGVLNIESGGLHGSEGGFNLPALLIRENCAFRPVKADEYLQFRHTIGVFNPAACKIDVFSLMEERSLKSHQVRIRSPVEGLTIQKFCLIRI